MSTDIHVDLNTHRNNCVSVNRDKHGYTNSAHKFVHRRTPKTPACINYYGPTPVYSLGLTKIMQPAVQYIKSK